MKKNKKIDLNGKPLESIQIGKIKKNNFGFVWIIILFALFAGIIYYLPDLEIYYDKYVLNKSDDNQVIPSGKIEDKDSDEDVSENTNVESTSYALVDNLKIEYNNLIYSNFNQTSSFNFNAINNTENSITIEHTFMELYDSSNTLKQRVMLIGTIDAYSNLAFSFNFSEKYDYVVIKQIMEEDYTYITLDLDSENKSYLTCLNANENITYTFKEETLHKVDYSISYLNTDPNYISMKEKYNTLVLTYLNTVGVTSSLTESSTGITYNLSIDYDLTNLDLKNVYYFDKKATPRKVNYEMEALLFACN